MLIRNIILSLALGIGASALPAFATTTAEGYVEVNAAPPPPQQEAVPEARAGYIWVPGYWGWSGSQHVWVNGQYVPTRPNHHWVAANWEHRGSHWYFRDGSWETDDESTKE